MHRLVGRWVERDEHREGSLIGCGLHMMPVVGWRVQDVAGTEFAVPSASLGKQWVGVPLGSPRFGRVTLSPRLEVNSRKLRRA